MVIRTNPELWEQVKGELMKDGNRWDARKAQRAVILYKKLGGEYVDEKPTEKNNSLVKWTKEKWQYIDEDNKGRYLPEIVIKKMSPKLKNLENKKKQKSKTPNAPYSQQLVKIMKKEKVL